MTIVYHMYSYQMMQRKNHLSSLLFPLLPPLPFNRGRVDEETFQTHHRYLVCIIKREVLGFQFSKQKELLWVGVCVCVWRGGIDDIYWRMEGLNG